MDLCRSTCTALARKCQADASSPDIKHHYADFFVDHDFFTDMSANY